MTAYPASAMWSPAATSARAAVAAGWRVPRWEAVVARGSQAGRQCGEAGQAAAANVRYSP